ncbi:hypothetical protein [Sedimenticola sp.]|uniref:hypothetical protein n=1 Tax=Sedimenticola sp. TaxID=1940285 RepID=UPI003D0C248E
MKFRDLKIGQKFLLRGVEMEKSGPLQAIEKATAKVRPIMRAAAVELLDEIHSNLTERAEPDRLLDELIQALNSYHHTCLSLLLDKENRSVVLQIESAYKTVQQTVSRLTIALKSE